jgi:transcriptional regulator with XRE-family HTH domain
MLADDIPGILRRVRRIANLSQRELAAVAGISPTTVAHIETRRHIPSLRVFETLVDVAGCALVVIDRSGAPLTPHDEGVRDRAGRHYPAYAELRAVGPRGEGWWGQRTVMPWVRPMPAHTFDRYRR